MCKTYLVIQDVGVSRIGSILSKAEQLRYVSIKIGHRHISVAKAQAARHKYERYVLKAHDHLFRYDELKKEGKLSFGAELEIQKSVKKAGIYFCLYLRELGLLKSISVEGYPALPELLRNDGTLTEYWESGYKQMSDQLYND